MLGFGDISAPFDHRSSGAFYRAKGYARPHPRPFSRAARSSLGEGCPIIAIRRIKPPKLRNRDQDALSFGGAANRPRMNSWAAVEIVLRTALRAFGLSNFA